MSTELFDYLENTRDYNLTNFKSAIEMLFSGQSNASSVANKYLNRFNNSNESFDVAISVLSLSDQNDKLYYNAIQVIKSKLKFNFGNYISDQNLLINLKNILLLNISKFKYYEKTYILSSLCQLYAYFTLFSFKVVPSIIDDLIKSSYDENSLITKTILIYYFSDLPEILNDKNIVIDEEMIVEFREFTKEYTLSAINLIKESINDLYSKQNDITSDAYLKFSRNILTCLSQWFDFGIKSDVLSQMYTNYNEIINFIFNITEDNLKLHKECICSLLCDTSISSNFFRNKENDKNVELLNNFIIEKVLIMKPLIGKAIEDKNNEGIKFFFDIFDSLCTQNIRLIVTSKSIDILKIMLELSKVCGEERILYVCDFWCEIINFMHISNSINDNEYSELIDCVIIMMINKTQWSKDVFIELNKTRYNKMKDNEDFSVQDDIRLYIKDFFNRISHIISALSIYNKYLKPLFQNTISEIGLNNNNIKAWNILESIIYCLVSIVKHIDKNDLPLLENVFLTIYDIPLDFIQICRIATDLVDEIKESITTLPFVFKKVLSFLINGLKIKLARKCCLISLQSLITNNKQVFTEYINDLAEIYKAQIHDYLLKDEDSTNFLKSFCDVIFSVEDNDKMSKYIVELCTPWVKSIFDKVSALSIPENNKKEEIYLFREHLFIFKNIISSAHENFIKNKNKTIQDLMCKILSEIWPVIKTSLQIDSEIIVEATIQVLKFFMRIMNNLFLPYLDEFLGIIIVNYKKHAFSSYLYCFEITVSVFGCATGDSFIYLKKVLSQLYEITFNYYLTNPTQMSNNTHLTDEIFGLLFRCFKINPLLILDSDNYEAMISMSINNIDIKHPDTAMNIISLLKRFITYQNHYIIKGLQKTVQEEYNYKVNCIMNNHGQSLVYKILFYIQEVPLENIFSFLLELNSTIIYLFANSASWYKTPIELIPDNRLTNSEKIKLIGLISDYYYLRQMMKTDDSDKAQENADECEEKIDYYIKLIYKRSLALYKRN